MSASIPTPPPTVATVPPVCAAPLAAPPKAADPPVASVAATTAEPEVNDDAEERSTFWRDFLYTSPTWGISMLLHIILVLSLAMYTTVEVLKPGTSVLTASMLDAPEALEEQTDDVIKFEELEVNPTAIENPNSSDSNVDASNTSMSPEKIENSSPSDLPAIADFGDAGSGLLTDFGEAMIDKPGSGTSASFFGVPAKGKKFCFVVDNSGSMKGAKFENALYELATAIDKLTPTQSFYIIFFSDKPYPLFYPSPASGFVQAIPKNKQLLAQWLSTVELHKQTKGSEAMKLALDLGPDVIYLLGDGAFTDSTVKDVLAREAIRTKIHTIGFNMKPGSRPAKDFEAIAQKFYGSYREVSEKPVK